MGRSSGEISKCVHTLPGQDYRGGRKKEKSGVEETLVSVVVVRRGGRKGVILFTLPEDVFFFFFPALVVFSSKLYFEREIISKTRIMILSQRLNNRKNKIHNPTVKRSEPLPRRSGGKKNHRVGETFSQSDTDLHG